VAFLHDEFILEVPDDVDLAHAANLRLMKHMVEGMKVYVPDVPIKAEPSLMRRWFKEAEPVFDEKGRLRVWESKEK
jgi:DNA polymerase-1